MAAPVVFIFGLGFVGRALGHMMAAAGWSIRGTTRQPEKFAAEAAVGWEIIGFSDQPLTKRNVPSTAASPTPAPTNSTSGKVQLFSIS